MYDAMRDSHAPGQLITGPADVKVTEAIALGLGLDLDDLKEPHFTWRGRGLGLVFRDKSTDEIVLTPLSLVLRDYDKVGVALKHLGLKQRRRPGTQPLPKRMQQPVTEDDEQADDSPWQSVPTRRRKMGNLPKVSYEEREAWDAALLLNERLTQVRDRIRRVRTVLAQAAYALPHQGVRQTCQSGVSHRHPGSVEQATRRPLTRC